MHLDSFQRFEEEGFIGPLRILTKQECQEFLFDANEALRCKSPLDWNKGYATSSRLFYDLAIMPAIVNVVSSLLGDHVMLWGARLIRRRPGAIHPWHSDMEAAATPEKSVSVWIGLEHATEESSLRIISYSHRFGISIQELRHRQDKNRTELKEDDVLRWARVRDNRSEFIKPFTEDGEAIFFHGQLWHSSHNASEKTRTAILLQYAVPQAPIRILNPRNLDWPFEYLSYPKPACIMVQGHDAAGVNRFVPPPIHPRQNRMHRLKNRIYPFRIPLPGDKKTGWKIYPVFKGRTDGIESLSCHISVLSKNKCPHPPHAHEEEEILFLMGGEVDLILPDLKDRNSNRVRLPAGQCVYYPAHFHHTLETVSDEPANYLMFKWRNQVHASSEQLGFTQVNVIGALQTKPIKEGFDPSRVFEGPTTFLKKLHCHVSTLTPGAGYASHVDPYDVAILLLDGEVETIGERVIAPAVIFYPAGEPHGILNPGENTAKYVVFEFRFYSGAVSKRMNSSGSSFATYSGFFNRLMNPQSWKKRLKRFLKVS